MYTGRPKYKDGVRTFKFDFIFNRCSPIMLANDVAKVVFPAPIRPLIPKQYYYKSQMTGLIALDRTRLFQTKVIAIRFTYQ